MKEKNLHEGHRQRMYAKLENPDNLYEHELLEILLYKSCPRVNTNPIAHALLDRFCSLSGIFGADINELKQVEGVGKSTAEFLKTVGLCFKRAGKVEGVAVLKNFGDCKKLTSMRLKGRTEEYLELYFTEKSGKVFRIFTYTSSDKNKVAAPAGEISKNFVYAKPYGVMIAHNHLNGSANPSNNDDVFTAQIQLLCNLHNVILLDHLIYADGSIYSYKDAGALDAIKREYSLDNTFKWKKISD